MFAKIDHINNIIEKILLSLGIICFIGLVLVVLLQIIARLWLPWPISWTEEISRFLFLYCIALLAPITVKNRELVFVDMVVMNFPAHIQAYLIIISDFLISILSIVILWTSIPYLQLGIGQIAPASGLPMYIPYATMFVLSFFLSIFSLSNWVKHIDFFMIKHD